MKRISASHRYIRSGDLRLHVSVTGEGPPVILLHGFPENGHSWRHQVPAVVAAGFSAWALDMRGYPPSDISPDRSAYRLQKLVDDVSAVVAALGYPRAVIAGHDWGGIIAWTFAGKRPALVDMLVIMNAPHMQMFADKVWRSSQFFRSLYAAFFQLPYLPEKLLAANDFKLIRWMFRHSPANKNAFSDADISHYVEGLSKPGALTAALNYYRANAWSDGFAIARRARVQAPTLVIWGERDPALGLFLLDGLENIAPDIRIHRIPHAGHWVQNEAPAEVNRMLRAFLLNGLLPSENRM